MEKDINKKARTPHDFLWKQAVARAERLGRGSDIKYIMSIYVTMGGEFKALDFVQLNK